MGVNQRAQIVLTDDELESLLAGSRSMTMATIGADGQPHLVAMWFALIDGDICFETKAKSQKAVNLRRDPRITCLVEAGTEFAEFRAVELRGRGEVSGDVETSRRTGLALYERAAGVLTDDMRGAVDAMAADRVAVTVVPDRTVSWDHRKLPGARPADVGR